MTLWFIHILSQASGPGLLARGGDSDLGDWAFIIFVIIASLFGSLANVFKKRKSGQEDEEEAEIDLFDLDEDEEPAMRRSARPVPPTRPPVARRFQPGQPSAEPRPQPARRATPSPRGSSPIPPPARPAPAQPSDTVKFDGETFTVVRILDGDTVELDEPDRDSATTRVRLLGIDAPELAQNAHFGPEAATFTQRMTQGRSVHVKLVPSQGTRDRYGRLLAYLFLEQTGLMVNEALVQTGHAYADTRYNHPMKSRFVQIEARAIHSRAGLWRDISPDQIPEYKRQTIRLLQPKPRPKPQHKPPSRREERSFVPGQSAAEHAQHISAHADEVTRHSEKVVSRLAKRHLKPATQKSTRSYAIEGTPTGGFRFVNRDDLRRAIVMSEILRPPLALRQGEPYEQTW